MRHRLRGARALVAVLGLALSLGACGYGNDDTETLGSDPYVTEGGTARVFAQFEPGIEVLPLPNDVVWAADGDPQVEFAPDPGDSTEIAQLKLLVNSLGLLGLSPNMFLTVPVTGEVDPETAEIIVFRLDGAGLPTLLGALASGNQAAIAAAAANLEVRTEADFAAGYWQGVLKLVPRTPLTPGAAYAVAIKTTLLDSDGFEVHPSFAMQALKSTQPFGPDSPYIRLQALRAAFNDPNPSTGAPGLLDIVAAVTGVRLGTPWTRDAVLSLWTLHTADRTLSLTPAAPDPADATLSYADFDQVPAQFWALSRAWPEAFLASQGVVVGPRLPPEALGPEVPQDALGGVYFGTFLSPDLATSDLSNPAAPVVQTAEIPFLLTLPNSPGPYRVVVFQHGIPRSKEDAFGIANRLASVGLATLAIDAPFHGDRTPDGFETGELFLTANLLMTRLNTYQAAVDLWETFDAVAAIDDAIEEDLVEGDVSLLGHSLGSMIGSVFLSQDSRPRKILLSSPAAVVTNAIDQVPFPSIRSVITSLGFTPGTADYYVFLDLAQWLLDPVDSAYAQLGENSTEDLLAVLANHDPVVTNTSTLAFLGGLEIPVEPVDPRAIVIGPPLDAAPDLSTFPPATAGGYRYGVTDPVIHSFLLTPLFDVAEDPWYEGFDPTVQLRAYGGVQAQMAGFLAQP